MNRTERECSRTGKINRYFKFEEICVTLFFEMHHPWRIFFHIDRKHFSEKQYFIEISQLKRGFYDCMVLSMIWCLAFILLKLKWYWCSFVLLVFRSYQCIERPHKLCMCWIFWIGRKCCEYWKAWNVVCC